MTKIESQKTTVTSSAERVFAFLTNFNNFEKLMPSQVTDWESTEETCSFNISGMASIGMKIEEKVPPTLVKIKSHGKVPFPFDLDIHIHPIEANSCEANMVFQAKLNPMVKMMVEKPLKNFFDLLTKKLGETNLDEIA